ncbi:MAG: hypothetical protein P8Y02_05665 [Deinococcales bacterium]
MNHKEAFLQKISHNQEVVGIIGLGYVGLPLAVVQPYPLQEEANANVLLEQGAAIRISPITTFSHKLRGFFAEPDRRRAMQGAARRMGRPDAARAVVASVRDELLGTDATGPDA